VFYIIRVNTLKVNGYFGAPNTYFGQKSFYYSFLGSVWMDVACFG